MTYTRLLSAQIKEFATGRLANAHASQIMMALLAKEPYARTNAAKPVFASPKINWRMKPTVYTHLHGMQRNKLVAYAI